jgi:anti-sigma B factor antagonist
MVEGSAFRYEIENSADQSRDNRVTTVKCHGRLVGETASDLKNVVKPLLAQGGRTVIDLSGVNYLDSSGLGALVGLKISAVNQGLCTLQFENMTPRVLELMRLTGLAQLMSS